MLASLGLYEFLESVWFKLSTFGPVRLNTFIIWLLLDLFNLIIFKSKIILIAQLYRLFVDLVNRNNRWSSGREHIWLRWSLTWDLTSKVWLETTSFFSWEITRVREAIERGNFIRLEWTQISIKNLNLIHIIRYTRLWLLLTIGWIMTEWCVLTT